MRMFWNIVGYEYKKIFGKRSVQVILFLATIVTVFSVPATLLGSYYMDGKPYESNYDAMIKDRGYALALSGRLIDSQLIMEAVHAYEQIPEARVYQSTKEYQNIARPYSQVYGSIRSVFNTASKRFNMEDFQILKESQAKDYYRTRQEGIEQYVRQTKMSKKAKEKVLAMSEEVVTPLPFSYMDGYSRYFTMINTLGLISAFVIAVCIAPLFAGEYISGADQLILSSKYGKNKLILAKLLTGFSTAVIYGMAQLLLALCLCMAIFGADGADAPLQLYMIHSPYPLNMAQTTVILTIVSLFAYLMTAAITMFLSTKLKTPFGVIVIVSVILIAPMLGSVSEQNLILYHLYQLFPTQMTSLSSVVDVLQFELGGIVIAPYIALPLAAFLISTLLSPISYQAFKRHTIG